MNKKTTKVEISIVSTVLFSIIFFFIYKFILIFYFTQRYDEFLFAYTSNYYSVIFFCGFIIIGVSAYFDDHRKMKPQKYWTIFSCIGLIIFILVGYFSTSGWIVTKEKITYCTIFSDNIAGYCYDDFENVRLYYNESIGIKGNGVSPEYKIETNDGEIIKLCLMESYYDSCDKLIEFDKLASYKRICEGEYIYLSNSLKATDELNQYYKRIFNRNNQGTAQEANQGTVSVKTDNTGDGSLCSQER